MLIGFTISGLYSFEPNPHLCPLRNIVQKFVFIYGYGGYVAFRNAFTPCDGYINIIERQIHRRNDGVCWLC